MKRSVILGAMPAIARKSSITHSSSIRKKGFLGVVSFRDLFSSRGDRSIESVMRMDIVTARDNMDQEALSDLFARHNLMMIPIVDAERRIKGIVTHDDIIDVLREEATEDIQKIGGTEALDAPYLQIPLTRMIKKRAGWLAALFIGEMLTATAMGYYEDQISRAVVLRCSFR